MNSEVKKLKIVVNNLKGTPGPKGDKVSIFLDVTVTCYFALDIKCLLKKDSY